MHTTHKSNDEAVSLTGSVIRQEPYLGIERRSYQRDLLQIELRLERWEGGVRGHTVNISAAGVRLMSKVFLVPGTPLMLRCCFGATAYLHLVGQVVFCRPNSPGAATGYMSGIKFAALREWERALLVSAIVELTTHGDTLGQSFLSIRISEDSLGLEAAEIAVHTTRTSQIAKASKEEGQVPTPKGILRVPKQIALEQRRHARQDAKILLRLKVEDKEVSGCTINISSKGLRLIAGTPLAAGTPLTLQWSFGGIGELTISGQVISCLPSENAASGTYVISIKFAAVRAWEAKIFESALIEIKRNSGTQEQLFLDIKVAKEAFALETAEFYKRAPVTTEKKELIRNSCVHASKITGWGAYLPPKEIKNEDVNALLNLNGSKTKFGDVVGSVTGIQSRRYAGSQMYPSDLAVEASRMALKNAGIDPKDIEVIISCGVARDVEEPATAYIIQEKLGASNAYCFDLANACNGFISAIDVMDSFIASGRCEIGLVAVGDVLSQYVTWDARSRKDLHLSSMSYTFGDGGGAAVVQRAHKDETQGIRASWFLSDGSYWRVAVIPLMDTERRLFKSNAPNIEEAALRHVPGGVREVMDKLNWELDDIALIIPHQVSSQINENLFYKELGMPPEKIFWSFPHHGNVGAASMPVALCAAIDQGRLKLGDKVLFVGGSGGFGAGVIGLVL